MAEKRNALVGSPVGKKLLRRSGRRWKGNNKMVWIALIRFRIRARGGIVAKEAMDLLVP
jgi:hypothetical protein